MEKVMLQKVMLQKVMLQKVMLQKILKNTKLSTFLQELLRNIDLALKHLFELLLIIFERVMFDTF